MYELCRVTVCYSLFVYCVGVCGSDAGPLVLLLHGDAFSSKLQITQCRMSLADILLETCVISTNAQFFILCAYIVPCCIK
jgi:hypothetical protein